MTEPIDPTTRDPRRLTGVPEIDGTTTAQIIVDGHELTVDQAKAPEPFKLTTQVGTVDLVLLDNEGEPHKIGEAEVVQGHITAHIDDDDAVRYLSGGTITLDRLDLLAEHSYPVEPILVHAPEGQIRVGHTCDMPGGLQITITDREMRGPMMAALAEIKTAALEGREPLERNVDAAIEKLTIEQRKLEGVVAVGGFTPRTEVSEVGPATFDGSPRAFWVGKILRDARGGDEHQMAKAITHALDLLGGVSLRELETRGLTSVQAANVVAMSRTTLEELHKRAVAAGIVTEAEPPWQTFEAAIAGMSQVSRRLAFVQARLDEAIRQLGRAL